MPWESYQTHELHYFFFFFCFFFFRRWTSFNWRFDLLNDILPLCSQSWTQVNQFLIFIWPRSCMMLSSHLYLGLLLGLVVKGFHLHIFLSALVSAILCIWPNQLSLWTIMKLTIFSCFISLSNSSLFLILHVWFSFVGPNIPLRIFLSKTSNFWIIFSFSSTWTALCGQICECWSRLYMYQVLYLKIFFFLSFNLWLVGSSPSGIVASHSFHCCKTVSCCVSGDLL